MNHTFKESIKSYILCCKLLIILIVNAKEDNPNTHGLYEFDLVAVVVVFCLHVLLLRPNCNIHINIIMVMIYILL